MVVQVSAGSARPWMCIGALNLPDTMKRQNGPSVHKTSAAPVIVNGR
jgi:hypothetical protein